MKRNLRFTGLLLSLVLAGSSFLPACDQPMATGYRTYALPDKGMAHLSFEYPAAFNVRQVQLFDDSGIERIDLDGPYSRKYRDRTTMWVVAQRFDASITIGDMIQAAMSVTGGLSGYRLIDRSTTNVNGITAEQFSYFYYASRTEYEKNILGFEPAPTVTRQVYFSYNNLQWTVAMTADENTVEADTPGFEHFLQTLTMLP